MSIKKISQHLSRLFEPTRVFIVLILVALIYLLPFESKPEFIEHNGQIISVPQSPPILISLYPEASYATCGQNGTGTNCQTGCCSAGQCVQCPPEPEDSPPSIQSALNCSQPGDNGWCRDSLSINLSASDPQGYSIIISGVFSGNAFACPVGATSCSIPVNNEEQGTISYHVDSSSGMAASGTRDYKVDRTTPQLDGSVSCVMGTNNWCLSNASLTVSASDSLSGIASITTTIDGGAANAYIAPIMLSDGVHSVTITASDNAGNVSQSTQIIQVDTLTPTINASLSGKNGKNNWYVSNVSLTSSANDNGSGIASLEVKIDNGAWTAVNGPATLPNGTHTWQLRATDNAGNLTETSVQTTYVDTVAPAIDMTEEIDLGDTLYYSLEDPTISGQVASGLSVYRAVIEDDEERYQKVVWLEALNENKLRGQILWDGKFKDGTTAGVGDYFITLKIADAAGNETVKSAVVHVHVYSFLQELPAFTPPASETSPTDEGQGNITSQNSSSNSQTEVSTIFGGVSASVGEAQMSSSSFGVESSTSPITNIPFDPSILWGAAAVALVGSTLAEWERQREEERKRREAEEAKLQKRENTEKRRAQKAQEAAVRERWAEDARQERANDASTARWDGLAQQAQAKAQDVVNDATAARWAGMAAIAQAKENTENASGGSKPLAKPTAQEGNPPDDKSWWDNFKEDLKYLWDKILYPEAPPTPKVQPWWLTPSTLFTATPAQTATPIFTPAPLSTLLPFKPTLFDFGIKTKGFDSSEENVILNAANLTSNKLLQYLPQLNYSSQAFQQAMGALTIMIDPLADIDEYDGNCLTTKNNLIPSNPKDPLATDVYQTIYYQKIDGELKITNVTVDTPQTIICKAAPDEANLIHEFDHALVNHQTAVQGINIFDLTRPISLGDGNYLDFQGSYWIRQETGFLDGQASWEHLPLDGDTTSGTAKVEHSADMFLNGIYDGTGNETYGFSSDESGDARREEFDWILRNIFGQ